MEREEFPYSTELSRTIKFNNCQRMHFIVDYVNGEYAVYHSSSLKWYENRALRFRIYLYSNYGYDLIYVYANDYIELEPDENGWYTVPGGTDLAVITASSSELVAPIPSSPTGTTSAAGCTHICHSNNRLIQFIWKIFVFFFRIFGINQYCECGAAHY